MRRLAWDVFQQCRDILADIVTARAPPEIFGVLVVMLQRDAGDFFQVLLRQLQRRIPEPAEYEVRVPQVLPLIETPLCLAALRPGGLRQEPVIDRTAIQA